ncbi:hypothetical protein A7J42_22240 [Brucella intermedia]|nr:hypothetical protein A7J42_22240 [Brucella intermedia]
MRPVAVLELVEAASDLISTFVFGFVMRDWLASVALCRDDGLDIGAGDLSRMVSASYPFRSGIYRKKTVLPPTRFTVEAISDVIRL